MIGLVLLSQGKLAEAFLDLLDHPDVAQRVRAVCIPDLDDLEKTRHIAMKAIDEVDQGQGVIVLTEVFCGASTNLAVSVMDLKRVEVVAGMNLPMILRILDLPEDTLLQEAAVIAKETGQKHISIASRFLDTFYDEQQSQPAA